MYDIIIHFAPSLLLLQGEDVFRIFLGIVLFSGIFFGTRKLFFGIKKMKPRRFVLHDSNAVWEKGSSEPKPSRGISWGLLSIFGVTFFLSCGLVWFESRSAHSSFPDPSIVFLGEREDVFSPSSPGRVLGEEDEISSLPSSENYRLGQISVGGDTEIYLTQQQNIPLDIFNISYRVMTEDNGERTNMLIEWKTNKPSRGTVSYRKHSEENFRTKEEESFNVEHALMLENLEPETTYVFYVTGKDKWGSDKEGERYAMYSGERLASLFDLLEEAFGDTFGWAMRGN